MSRLLTRLLTRRVSTLPPRSTIKNVPQECKIQPAKPVYSIPEVPDFLQECNPGRVINKFKKYSGSNPSIFPDNSYIMPRTNYSLRWSVENKSPMAMWFNMVLILHIKNNEYESAEKHFEDAEKHFWGYGFRPTKSSYEIMIKGFCMKGTKESLERSMWFLDEAEEKGIMLDMDAYYNILDGLYKQGRFWDGEKLLKRVEEKEGITHDGVLSYHHRIEGLVNEGLVDEAANLLKEMKLMPKLPLCLSFNELIRGYCTIGKLDQAKSVYRDFLNSGYEEDLFTYQYFIPPLCQNGEFDFAIYLAEKCIDFMFDYCFAHGEVQVLVDELVKHSRMDDAKRLVELANSKYFLPEVQLKLPSKDMQASFQR